MRPQVRAMGPKRTPIGLDVDALPQGLLARDGGLPPPERLAEIECALCEAQEERHRLADRRRRAYDPPCPSEARSETRPRVFGPDWHTIFSVDLQLSEVDRPAPRPPGRREPGGGGLLGFRGPVASCCGAANVKLTCTVSGTHPR